VGPGPQKNHTGEKKFPNGKGPETNLRTFLKGKGKKLNHKKTSKKEKPRPKGKKRISTEKDKGSFILGTKFGRKKKGSFIQNLVFREQTYHESKPVKKKKKESVSTTA